MTENNQGTALKTNFFLCTIALHTQGLKTKPCNVHTRLSVANLINLTTNLCSSPAQTEIQCHIIQQEVDSSRLAVHRRWGWQGLTVLPSTLGKQPQCSWVPPTWVCGKAGQDPRVPCTPATWVPPSSPYFCPRDIWIWRTKLILQTKWLLTRMSKRANQGTI